jgi:hypothetical protein
MAIAYVSRRCEDCSSFVAAAAGRLSLIYVEDAVELPWYIESVPTVVVETRGDDGRLGYDLYAGDDAFALIEPRREAEPERPDAPEPPRARAPAPPRREEPPARVDLGPCARGDEGAVFECVETEDGMSCGAFEALAPLGTDDDRLRTEHTIAEWERAVAEERARSEKKETSQLDRDFEKLKKERGN